jgi:hypothetical protein
MESNTKNEVLLLTGQAGDYYAIPVSDLAKYQVSREGKDELEQIFGAEVQGYDWKQNFVLANPMRDPSSIFGGGPKKGVGINGPSIDPYVQMGRVASTLLIFVGRILVFDSAVSTTDILKRIE